MAGNDFRGNIAYISTLLITTFIIYILNRIYFQCYIYLAGAKELLRCNDLSEFVMEKDFVFRVNGYITRKSNCL